MMFDSVINGHESRPQSWKLINPWSPIVFQFYKGDFFKPIETRIVKGIMIERLTSYGKIFQVDRWNVLYASLKNKS